MSDFISRQAAIDALEKVAELYPWRVPGDRDSYSQYNEAWHDALNRADSEIEELPSAQSELTEGEWKLIKKLRSYHNGTYAKVLDKLMAFASAQPEPLTDKEQRIFLAAMSREETVCKQVDEEWRDCREPYEDSLVRVCHEIIRKVFVSAENQANRLKKNAEVADYDK